MKKTFSNGQMMNYISVMERAKEEHTLAYAIACNLRAFRDVTKEFVDFRNDLFEKYGDINKTTGEVKIREENREAYQNEIRDLLNIEHDVEILTVPKNTFIEGNLDNVQMEALLWMVEPPIPTSKNEEKTEKGEGEIDG